MATKELIKEKLGKDARWVERGIVVLYSQQTTREQDGRHTEELNGVGFNMLDADLLSSFAEQINMGRPLSQRQLAVAYKMLPKYAGQLFKLQKEKEVNG